MNHKYRTFITIVCSILLIMPSLLGVPLADGNRVLVPTPDSGQVNDEISTITDLNDENIKTITTTELLLQADSEESDLSYSDEIQELAIRAENGNEENENNSIPAEHLEGEESNQVGQSDVVEETIIISQEQLPAENESEPSPSWSSIPDLSAIGNNTDGTGLLVDPETPIDDVNSTLLNDVLPLDDVNLATAEDALFELLLNATYPDEELYAIVEKLDLLNYTLGMFTGNETILTPTSDLNDVITSTIEATNNELGSDIVDGDSLTIANTSQPIFDTLAIDPYNTTTSLANLESNASDSSQHTIWDVNGIANSETLLSPTNEISESPIESDDISSTIAEKPQIPADLSANDFDARIDSSLIQGVDEIAADNNGENTFTSDSSTIDESESNSVDSVTSLVSNTNSGSNGQDDNNSNYGRSDGNHNDGRCSDNSVQDHGDDKHKQKEKNNNKDGDKGNGEEREDEHHAGSERSDDHDERLSHNDSNHQNRGGSDDDRNRDDHEDEHENNHDDDNHEEHDHDGA